ncbi:hypothetical protein Ancab_005594 [Ancistrocladus abbreviatus]
MDDDELDIADNVYQEDEITSIDRIVDMEEQLEGQLHRDDLEVEIVEGSKVYKRRKELRRRDEFVVDVEDLDATLDEYCNDHEETKHVHDPLDYDSDILDGQNAYFLYKWLGYENSIPSIGFKSLFVKVHLKIQDIEEEEVQDSLDSLLQKNCKSQRHRLKKKYVLPCETVEDARRNKPPTLSQQN